MNLRSVRSRITPVVWLAAAAVVGAPSLRAQMGSNDRGTPSGAGMPAIFQKVGFDQKLDNQVPLDATFRDESGKTVKLGDYFGSKPVLLSLVYYECPMLCTQVLNGMLRSMRALSFDAGKEYEVVTVSIDPHETPDLAAEKKASYIHKYNRRGAENGWHFLVGDEPSIKRLADAVGFRYAYDAPTKQFAHASGITVLTPQGKLARYYYGVEYSTRDLRLGLVEAAAGKIGNPVDQFLLFCYHYDPSTGKYGAAIQRIIRVSGTATVLGIAAMIFFLARREKRRNAAPVQSMS